MQTTRAPFLATLIGVSCALLPQLAATDPAIAGDVERAGRKLEEIENAVKRLRELLVDIEARLKADCVQTERPQGAGCVSRDPDAIVVLSAGKSRLEPLATQSAHAVPASVPGSTHPSEIVNYPRRLDQDQRPTLDWLAQAVPCCVRPVPGGVWMQYHIYPHQDRSRYGQQVVAFLDQEQRGIRLVIIGGLKDWDAFGDRALAISKDRTDIFLATTNPRSVTRYPARPKDYKWFDNVVAYGRGFLISSPYKPLWLLDPYTGDSRGLSLARVRDQDFEKLGGGDYYQPIVRSLVPSERGDLWGRQGTLDGDRGNAIFHYSAQSGDWTHFLFPNLDTPSLPWPLGMTDRGVWLQRGKSDILLNPAQRPMQFLTCEWPDVAASGLEFVGGNAYVARGTSVYRLAPEGCEWQKVLSMDGVTSIQRIRLQANRWTLATPGAIQEVELNEHEEPQGITTWPIRLTDDVVVYEIVKGPADSLTSREDAQAQRDSAQGQDLEQETPMGLKDLLKRLASADTSQTLADDEVASAQLFERSLRALLDSTDNWYISIETEDGANIEVAKDGDGLMLQLATYHFDEEPDLKLKALGIEVEGMRLQSWEPSVFARFSLPVSAVPSLATAIDEAFRRIHGTPSQYRVWITLDR